MTDPLPIEGESASEGTENDRSRKVKYTGAVRRGFRFVLTALEDKFLDHTDPQAFLDHLLDRHPEAHQMTNHDRHYYLAALQFLIYEYGRQDQRDISRSEKAHHFDRDYVPPDDSTKQEEAAPVMPPPPTPPAFLKPDPPSFS
jgi:hypothetical protein